MSAMKRRFFSFMVFVLLLGCGGADTGVSRPKPKARPKHTEQVYPYMEADYMGLPAPVGSPGTGLYVTHTVGGRLVKVEKRDPEGAPLTTWEYTYDGTYLKEVVQKRLATAGAHHIFLEYKSGRTCALYTGRLGARETYKCWTKRADGTVEERSLDAYGKLVGRRILTVDSQGIVTRADIYDRSGALSATETVKLGATKNGIRRTYRRVGAFGALQEWEETVYHPAWALPVSITGFYADGSVRYRTTLNYDSPYSAKGKALTEEGAEYDLEVHLDLFGHRLTEKRLMGGSVKELFRYTYDDAGRLLTEEHLDDTGRVSYRDEREYDDSGLLAREKLFRGMSAWLLVCEGEHGERVTTRLPALERAQYAWDPLGRPTSMERYLMERFTDRQARRYGARGLPEMESELTGNGREVKKVYTRDESGRIVQELQYVGGSPVKLITYRYDGDFLVEERHLTPDGRPFTRKQAPTGSVIRYHYDGTRLVEKRFLHADGAPAVALHLPKCGKCPARPMASRIVWHYDSRGLLDAVTYYDDTGEAETSVAAGCRSARKTPGAVSKRPVSGGKPGISGKDSVAGTRTKPVVMARQTMKYDSMGRIVSRKLDYPTLGRQEVLETQYAPGGWVSKTTHSVFVKGRLQSMEARTFDRALLTGVLRRWLDSKGSMHTRDVRMTYSKGLLHTRSVNEDGKVLTVVIQRDPAGRKKREIALDGKGRPARAKDLFGNEYEELASTYDPAGRIVRVARKLGSRVFRTEFSYDDKGRPTGRRVYEGSKLVLDVKEFFSDPYIGPYGSATYQVRRQMRGNRVEVSSYRIHFDPSNPERSYAVLKAGSRTVKLDKCRCEGCGNVLDWPVQE